MDEIIRIDKIQRDLERVNARREDQRRARLDLHEEVGFEHAVRDVDGLSGCRVDVPRGEDECAVRGLEGDVGVFGE